MTSTSVLTVRTSTASERSFLIELLQVLEKNGVITVYLKNYESFPEHLGRDVDLYVPLKDLEKVHSCIKELIEKYKPTTYYHFDRSYVRHYILSFSDCPYRVLQIDFIHGCFSWHGFEFLEEEYFLNQLQKDKYCYYLRPAHKAYLLFFYTYLWGGFLSKKYFPNIKELLSDSMEEKEFFECTKKFFGTDFDKKFIYGLINSDSNKNNNRYLSLRRKLVIKSLLRSFSKSSKGWMSYVIAELKNYLYPQGICIVLYGPDGVGKSTLISNVVKKCSPLFCGVYKQYHLRPRLFPEIGIALGLRKEVVGTVKPTKAKPTLLIVSWIRLFYYWLDFQVGYFFKVRRELGKFNLVLFDRFLDDYLVDPKRYRFNNLGKVGKFFALSLFRPQLCFVLVGDPNVIRSRKDELDFDTLNKLLVDYRKFALERGYFLLDVSESADELSNKIYSIVSSKLSNKLSSDGGYNCF